MSESILVRAFVATAPVLKSTPNGVPVTSFRIASTPRWYDQSAGVWRESSTNWYSVNAFRALAQNVARSVRVGQPVVVSGRLKVKKWDREDGTTVTNVEIDAQSVGHDLNFGTAHYERTVDRRPLAQDGAAGVYEAGASQDQQQFQNQPSGPDENVASQYHMQQQYAREESSVTNVNAQGADSLDDFADMVENPETARDEITAMTR